MYKIILILIYSISFQIVAQNQVLDLDGNQYDIINIGGQVWFKQNLRTTKFSNGEIIPNSIGNGTWAIEGMPAWCYWYNDSVNQYPQGTLYNWYSVNDSRNICPQGWKVPTIADWTILFANFGGNQLAGEALKDTGTIENGTGLWHAPNLATNISDFTCVPLGYRSQNGTFGGGYEDAWYWTNSINVNDQTEGVYLELHGYSKGVGLSYADRKTGFSVRCVQSATSNLNELTSPKKEVLYYTNTLGQKVSPNNLCNAIVIVHYDDGSTLLKFIP